MSFKKLIPDFVFSDVCRIDPGFFADNSLATKFVGAKTVIIPDVDFQGLRFIVIDTQGLRWLHDYTRLNTWLTDLIRQANGRYIVVMMHHPVYSASKGRVNPAVYLSCITPLRQADLVLAGHDHQYARQLPFVEITSTTTSHQPRFKHYHERQGMTDVYYQRLTLVNDTLTMRTYRLADALLYDECCITH